MDKYNKIIIYQEKMNSSELSYLIKRYRSGTYLFFRIIKRISIICIAIPVILAIIHLLSSGLKNLFVLVYFLLAMITMICILLFGSWYSYRNTYKKMVSDIKTGNKTIELSIITKKRFMPNNNSYHFYISSPNKLSIEVSSSDYYKLDKGDEINIEYSSKAKVYFGYF